MLFNILQILKEKVAYGLTLTRIHQLPPPTFEELADNYPEIEDFPRLAKDLQKPYKPSLPVDIIESYRYQRHIHDYF